MYTLDDILRTDTYDNSSQIELLEIITTLRNELKYQLYKNDNNRSEVLNKINNLEFQLSEMTALNLKYKSSISNFNKMYNRKLTIKERILGNINPNVTIEKNKKNI